MAATATRMREIYDLLFEHYGPQHWWPAESPFEVMVGAVLTQNTNWQNVCKAIDALRGHGVLSLAGLSALDETSLAALITPAGYYNLKSRRLKNLVRLLNEEYGGDLDSFLQEEPARARQRLLGVKGIGPETADSILLYAAQQPVFVVDAYTHRIFSRHHLLPDECDYQTVQDLFMDHLPHDVALFNEYHALIVRTAKDYCRKSKPLCDRCPLKEV